MPTYKKTEAAIAKLSPEEYRVTQESGTECPGKGALLYNKEAGIYVDIVSGEPLFASSDKYESGCGWPSFTKPIEPANVNELRDTSHGMVRAEVRSTHGDSHLGHVSRTGLAIVVGCVTASIRRRCASCLAPRWWSRATVTISTRWRISNDN